MILFLKGDSLDEIYKGTVDYCTFTSYQYIPLFNNTMLIRFANHHKGISVSRGMTKDLKNIFGVIGSVFSI